MPAELFVVDKDTSPFKITVKQRNPHNQTKSLYTQLWKNLVQWILTVTFFPHISVWGSCFLLLTRRLSSSSFSFCSCSCCCCSCCCSCSFSSCSCSCSCSFSFSFSFSFYSRRHCSSTSGHNTWLIIMSTWQHHITSHRMSTSHFMTGHRGTWLHIAASHDMTYVISLIHFPSQHITHHHL